MRNSSKAFARKRSTTWRWMDASERRRLSGRGGKGSARASALRLSLALTPLQPDQETVTEHDQVRIAMKAMPQASLVLIPAEQTLGLFVKLLDPVAPVGVFDHRAQRRLGSVV